MRVLNRIYIASATSGRYPYLVTLARAEAIRRGGYGPRVHYTYEVLSRHLTRRGASRGLVKAQKKYRVAN